MTGALPFERVIYRNFRRAKAHYIERPNAPLAKPFFRMFGLAEKVLAPRQLTPEEIERNEAWKADYARHFAGPLFRVETAAPIAESSDDHKHPRGAATDNSTNPRFNQRLYQFMPKAPITALDLGCSGGGFVRSLLQDGHTAIGLEGSDSPRKQRRAEWDTCDKHLFTCDIAKPFSIFEARTNEQIKFDLITAWEVLEHIPESVLPGLMSNIRNNLADDGCFVGSVALFPDGNPLVGATYHVTLQPRDWWLARFADHGLVPVERHPFETKDYVRGHGMGLKDWDPADGDGFHVVMRKA